MFVTTEEVLAYVGVKTPSEADTLWASLCARAVNDGVMVRLNCALITDPPPDELHIAATMAAGEAYKRREAPFGGTYYEAEAVAVNLARDYLNGVAPIIARYSAGPGIG